MEFILFTFFFYNRLQEMFCLTLYASLFHWMSPLLYTYDNQHKLSSNPLTYVNKYQKSCFFFKQLLQLCILIMRPKYLFPLCTTWHAIKTWWMDAGVLWWHSVLLGDLYSLLCLVHGGTVSVTVQSEKGGWLVSPEQASYLCAYKCSVFPKKPWQQIYYTWKERAREDSAHLNIYFP